VNPLHDLSEARGLQNLSRMPLSPASIAQLDLLDSQSSGSRAWRARKRVEAHELLALAEIAPTRMKVRAMDLRADLIAFVDLRVPLPLQDAPSGEMRVHEGARLVFALPASWLTESLPGTALVEILAPLRVFHPNVHDKPPQRLCLGPYIEAALPLRELVLLAWGALSLQTVQLDERDPAGLLNLEAARALQARPDLIPLTREAFLTSSRGSGGAT